MSRFERIKNFFRRYFFNAKWRCNVCGREIFEGYFCDRCKSELPRNDGAACAHCGRALKVASEYCTTCKNKITSVDKGRSVFVYSYPVDYLVRKFKYGNAAYLARLFADELVNVYYKAYFGADALCYVPMTARAEKARGYNQSRLLCEELSKRIDCRVIDALVKVKDTPKQTKLKRSDRLKNLSDAFKVKDKEQIKGKTLLLVDDVTTTGATAEAIANKLKKAGASAVYLITVASVPPKDGY